MAERLRMQPVQIRGIGQHADVARAGAQRVGDLVAKPLFQIHRHARVVFQEIAQHRRQVFA
ncbi:hypothetical protein D3C85_1713630 [compost metagenome]